MDNKKYLFIDMDGTIARFYERADCLERQFEPQFFRNLKPYDNVLSGLFAFYNHNRHYPYTPLNHPHSPLEAFILSAVHSNDRDRVVAEKKAWIHEQFFTLPKENTIFTNVGENKAEFVMDMLGRKLNKNDFLIDDYNRHLRDWKAAGGTAIKLVNEINDVGTNGPLWDGLRIRYDFSGERIEEEMKQIVFSSVKRR